MKSRTMGIVFLLVGTLIGLYAGIHMADQAALRDCAMRGKAPMLGGGTVWCQVEKLE